MFGYVPLKIKKKQFNDIKEGYSYYACKTLECKKCGFLFLDQRFEKEEFKNYYFGYQNKNFFKQRVKFEKSFKNRIKNFKSSGIIAGKFNEINVVENFILKNIDKPNHILDFGAGDGKGTVFIGNKKIKKTLFDPFNYSRNNNTYSKLKFKNLNIDLITLRNVLEHVPYPIELLKDIIKMSKKKTKFYIEVPKEKIIDKISKKKRYIKKIIWTEHINFFNFKALKMLLEICDLKIIKKDVLVINKGNKGVTDNDREHYMLIAEKK